MFQEKVAELQAGQDSNISLARATSLSSCTHTRSRVKKKKQTGNKLTKHKHTNNTRSHGHDHYRVQLKDIPFVVGTSICQSHSVGANYQQLIALLKNHNTAVCGKASHGSDEKEGNVRGREPSVCIPKEDSRRFVSC